MNILPETENEFPEDPKVALFFSQKDTLDKFLERGVISKAQYDKSLGDLKDVPLLSRIRYCYQNNICKKSNDD